MMRATRGICLTALAACSGAAPGAGGPSPSFDAREDRVLITTFSNVEGVAVSDRYTFAVSGATLATYERRFRQWLPPHRIEDRFVAGDVQLMAADPLEEAVWIAGSGRVLYVRVFPPSESSALVAGRPSAIMFDARNPSSGAFVLASGGWVQLSRTGAAFRVSADQLPPPGQRLVAPTLRTVLDRYPSLRNFAPLLTRDGSNRSWPIISGAAAPNESEVWLGSRGGGLFRVDPVFNQSEQIEYGLLDEGAGALARLGDDVLAAPLGLPGSRGGLTHMSADLQRWRWLESNPFRPLADARAFDMDASGDAIWVATERGVARVDARNAEDVRLWSTSRGLPAAEALSVAATPTGAWVGTAAGAVFIAGDRASDPVGGGVPVRALALSGDTLWVGTESGLFALSPATPGGALRRPAAAEREPRLTQPIRALALADSVLVVVTERDLLLVNRRSGVVTPGAAATSPSVVGPISAAAADGNTIWVTGGRGVIIFQRGSALTRVLSAPGQIPGAAYDVTLDPAWAWVATREGVLRMRRSTDGMPR